MIGACGRRALLVGAMCGVVPASGAVEPPASVERRVAVAGARSSHYGIRPFPTPEEWVRVFEHIRQRFPGSGSVGVWIVGGLRERRGCRLEFPGEAGINPEISFEDSDRHEPYLDAFDRAGIRVYLQVEPGLADPETLIDLVLSRYRHHPSVIGFGIDVEWHREAEYPGWGKRVDDETARRWEVRVRAHKADYRLFLKHWDPRWMPPRYRGDLVFIDDSQELAGLQAMVEEFAAWGRTFAPNPVSFQIGYRSDAGWWCELPDPIGEMGRAICARVSQPCGIVWVDFTLRDVIPPGVLSPPEGGPSPSGDRPDSSREP